MARKQKKAALAANPDLTLAQLSEQYLEHMEREGKSAGTCFSYGMELRLAQAELGAETRAAAITAEDVARFNECDRVTKLKSGKPKAEPSILKSRRVLRLALAWAAEAGLIEASPIPSKQDAGVEAPEPKPAPRKGGRRKALAVPQAEAAAEVAEAAIAGTDDAA